VDGVVFVPVRDLPEETFDTFVAIAWVDRVLPPHLAELAALIRQFSGAYAD
jgi:hypothetical protein